MAHKKRRLNEGLKRKQEEQRQKTVAVIEEAIKSFENENYQDITIQMLIDTSGYTRPTFSKPHVQELLKKYRIGKYKCTLKLPKSDENKMKFLEKKVQEYMNSNEKLTSTVKELNFKIKNMRQELTNAKLEIEYLNQEMYEVLKKQN